MADDLCALLNGDRERVAQALWEWIGREIPVDMDRVHEWSVLDGADAVLAALDLPARDEQMRAEGRAQADNATLWHTTCVNCAHLYDQLMGERERGAAAERNRIAAALQSLTTDGHHSTLIPRDEALAIVVGQDEEGGR